MLKIMADKHQKPEGKPAAHDGVGILPDSPEGVSICGMSVTFCQDSDTNSDDQSGQDIAFELQDSGAGFYVTVKTDRWAVEPEDAEWMAEVVRRMCGFADAEDSKRRSKAAQSQEKKL